MPFGDVTCVGECEESEATSGIGAVLLVVFFVCVNFGDLVKGRLYAG